MTDAWSSNDWPRAWVEPVNDPDAWHLKMSVVIPAFERLEQLEVLLESLTQQTYPSELTEILVVDDGSEPPLAPILPDGLHVRILRQERDGFGLARARNLGAYSSTGDVVVFLDADMIPEHQWVEAHARPHHHQPLLAAPGQRTHVSRLSVTMEEVQSGAAIEEVLADSDPEQPQWILDRWATTNDGRIGDDIWWGMSGGNFSVNRQLFVDVGGYDEEGFREWGGEDNDLGYRIYQSGAFVVPVHDAMAWHLGPATNDAVDIEERRRRVKVRLASRVASDALPRIRGVTFRIADIAVDIDRTPSFERAVALISQILSDTVDVPIKVSVTSPDRAEESLLADLFAWEPRVLLGEPDATMTFAPITVQWRSDSWPDGLARWLRANVGEGRSGVVRIIGDLGTSTVWSTRIHHQVESRLLDEAATYNRFGGRTLDWNQLLEEIMLLTSTEIDVWKRRTAAAEARLTEMSKRRAMKLANTLGSLVRVRSWSEARRLISTSIYPRPDEGEQLEESHQT